MKPEHKKKYILALIAIFIIGGTFWWAKAPYQNKKAKKTASHPSPIRDLASLEAPTAKNSAQKMRTPLRDGPLTKKIESSLREILHQDKYTVVIDDLGAVKDAKYKHLETSKVRVNIRRKDGLESSYLALVNSKNGTILRTWAKTQYERRLNVPLNSENRGLAALED